MSYHHDQLQRLRCHRFEGCNWTHQFYKKGSERINFFAYPIALNYFGTLFASIWLIYLSQGVWNLSIQDLCEAPANSWKHRNWGTCAINQFTVKGFDHFFSGNLYKFKHKNLDFSFVKLRNLYYKSRNYIVIDWEWRLDGLIWKKEYVYNLLSST